MDYFELNQDQRRQLAAACDQEGIDRSYEQFVATHLDAADDSWRWCCSSNCDPCVNTLARAVDRARQALCIGPPGLGAAEKKN